MFEGLERPSGEAHHLGGDDFDPGHEEGVLALHAVHGGGWNVVDSQVGLMEHVPREH
jgi:hypothetical protein